MAAGKLCPVCYPVVGAFLSAIGVGIATQVTVLKGLLLLFLGIGLWGLWRSHRVHRKLLPFLLAILSAILLYTGKYLLPFTSIFYVGIAGLIIAVILDIRAAKTGTVCTDCEKKVKNRGEQIKKT